jgi:hypothetical protein
MRESVLMLSLCLGAMLLSIPGNYMHAEDQELIAALKATPVSQIESGFPDQPFGTWFEQHSDKGSEIRYFPEACEGSNGDSQGSGKDGPLCVTVTRAYGIGYLVIQFMVSRSQTAREQYTCKFLIGTEGPPPGSLSKRRVRVFHKLGEIFPQP